MRLTVIWLILAGALVVAAVLSLVSGPGHVGIAEFSRGLSATEGVILYQLRLPRLLMAIFAGAALAVSGALMQTLFRNPLAEPYITGVSAGGALGAVLGRAAGVDGPVPVGLAALVGAGAVTAVLFIFAVRWTRGSVMSLLLLGVALGTLAGSLVWLVLLRAGPGGTGEAITWLLGRVATVGYNELVLLIPAVVVGIALAFYFVPDLDALLLGEEKAASLGVNIAAARAGILAASTLLAAACVAFCGVIAFLGLMVPHVLRLLIGARHARLLPLAALGGAVLLVYIDVAARVLDQPREIPLSILLSLLGAPFFVFVLLRSQRVAL